jgi:proteasome lid subunit RPN8/RPN11
MNLILRDEHLDLIKQHGQSAYPEEGGGLLLGHVDDGRTVVSEIRVLPNTWDVGAERRRRYLIPGDVMLREMRSADACDLEVVGYFHSHPDHPAIPSQFDRDHALPNWSYVIVSVRQGQAGEVLAWELREDRSTFEAREIIVHLTDSQPGS